jgi:murein DD-endopeptidase MepM/ murein hydrolase activator NlpD
MKVLDGVMVFLIIILLLGGFGMFKRAGAAGVDPSILTMEPVVVNTPAVEVSEAPILLPPSEEEIAQFDYGVGVDFEAPPELQVEEEVVEEECDPAEFIAPYKDYKITQGPHGMSYGHFAIDLAAGKGAVVRSPICGEVTQLYTDEYGNPTLVIENEFYQVTMLHGDYHVDVGKKLDIGKKVGTEGNHGYTLTYDRRLQRYVHCGSGSGCGFHTHLNVYDKRAGSNVNPLDLMIGR